MVDDACHAYGSRSGGRMIGAFRSCSAFSFYATKKAIGNRKVDFPQSHYLLPKQFLRSQMSPFPCLKLTILLKRCQ
ncbi:MAG: hypothetical protein GQ565_09360 [Candidatus Aegiribacteria sp.]|nr:hypothetical protein [Candidatus Aegiribacteria sp.]